MRARLVSAIVIGALVGGSGLAASAPVVESPSAAKLSVVRNARVGAKVKRGNSLAGAAIAILVVAGAAATAGIIAAADGGNSASG